VNQVSNETKKNLKTRRNRKMKKILVLALAMGLVLALGGVAMAAGTNTLTVNASVTGTCKFSTATSTLNFGALDPSVGTNAPGSTTTQFWCTKGVTTDNITADNGANWSGTKRQMKDPVSTDVIPYTLTVTKDGSANTGPALPRTLTIDGQVLGTDYTSKSAGSYSDTVVISITP
jgi:hypothetical protein